MSRLDDLIEPNPDEPLARLVRHHDFIRARFVLAEVLAPPVAERGDDRRLLARPRWSDPSWT